MDSVVTVAVFNVGLKFGSALLTNSIYFLYESEISSNGGNYVCAGNATVTPASWFPGDFLLEDDLRFPFLLRTERVLYIGDLE